MTVNACLRSLVLFMVFQYHCVCEVFIPNQVTHQACEIYRSSYCKSPSKENFQNKHCSSRPQKGSTAALRQVSPGQVRNVAWLATAGSAGRWRTGDRKRAVSSPGETPTDSPTLCHLEGLLPGGQNENSENLAAGDRQNPASQRAVELPGRSNEKVMRNQPQDQDLGENLLHVNTREHETGVTHTKALI